MASLPLTGWSLPSGAPTIYMVSRNEIRHALALPYFLCSNTRPAVQPLPSPTHMYLPRWAAFCGVLLSHTHRGLLSSLSRITIAAAAPCLSPCLEHPRCLDALGCIGGLAGCLPVLRCQACASGYPSSAPASPSCLPLRSLRRPGVLHRPRPLCHLSDTHRCCNFRFCYSRTSILAYLASGPEDPMLLERLCVYRGFV